ncbi:hypothetical protein DAT35_32795 [Vitiosangium sp. GDMCC 1.1324]|nr:hypothetical protein DAT35_32795 [Vitiosangium sp. GDMCC 1.1324]
MRSWVSQPRGPGQFDAELAQFLCLLRSGDLELDLDGLMPGSCHAREILSCDRTLLPIPPRPAQGGCRGTSRE